MIKQSKKAYEAPMVEVMNARIEKGFAGSTAHGGTLPPNSEDGAQDVDNPIDFD